MSITFLKERMTEINESINLLSSSVATQATAQILLRNRLRGVALDTAEAFAAFQQENEDKAEAAANPKQWSETTIHSIAAHLEALKSGAEANSYETILARNPSLNFKAKASDDLAVEDSDLSNFDDAEDSTEETTVIYEKPDNEAKITSAVLSTAATKDSSEAQDKGTQESFALNVVLNEKQLLAKEMALAGKDYVLIGPAGSGKTTSQRAVAEALLQDKRLSVSRFKAYNSTGARVYSEAPSIAFCAYTRRAAANLAKAILKSPILAKELPANIMTIHALLEFEPETYFDSLEKKEKFRFAPKRTAENPLDITHLVIEESSMLGLDLWQQLWEALPEGVQIIFIGDINQLPPVFGPSILNYALVQLPIVELTETYRNQGIVLENAHHILRGEEIEENEHFTVLRGKSPVAIGQNKMSYTLGAVFKQLYDTIDETDGLRAYDPDDCIVLSPFNKQELGTDNMNKWLAQFLGEKRDAIVHEVIAGFNKLYLAVGDKVMYNKMDATIVDIKRNADYHGKEPQLPGRDMTRFGVRIMGAGHKDSLDDISLDYSGFTLEQLEEAQAERKQQCSHVVTIQHDAGHREELKAAGDFQTASFSLGYALTVHKAQGSEWRKVFLILHKDHAVSLYRELFYTAVTRARTKVCIIAKDPTIKKAIANQRIKGNNLADKLEYFNSGADMRDGVYASKR